MNKARRHILLLVLLIYILLAIIRYPDIALQSASKGLNTWFNMVIPSLLPFLIISEVLIQIGLIDIVSKLSEPLIKLIFGVSGAGAFTFSISVVSGYPIGTKIVSDLRQNKIISKLEADKMICFSSTSGPLFMIGTISIGMLNNSSLIPLIVYPHYLGAITIGILMRFYRKNDSYLNLDKTHSTQGTIPNLPGVKSNASIGSLLSDSVQKGINTMALIGGFIVFYSVLVELIFVSIPFNEVEHLFHMAKLPAVNADVLKGMLSGLFEITTGCNTISNVRMNVLNKILIINFLVGWSGFSIHSQALSFISRTDINAKLYIFSKLLHGLFSALYSFILYKIIYSPIIKTFLPLNIPTSQPILPKGWFNIFINSFQAAIITTIFLLISSLIISLIFNLYKRL